MPLERLMRNQTVWRRLPLEFGRSPVLVSPDARLRYLMRTFDPELYQLAKDHIGPKSVVWNVGPNVGVFSVAAAVSLPQLSRLKVTSSRLNLIHG